jgi:hypothetical protein
VGFELLRQRASEGRKKKEEGKKKMNVPGPLNEEGREEKRMEGGTFQSGGMGLYWCTHLIF